MVDAIDVLPPHAGAAELALTQAVIDAASLPMPIRDVWRAQVAPSVVLPWLAWALSVDEWGEDWSDEVQRNSIEASIEIHRHKGTIHSIRLALRSAGYGEATILEGFGGQPHDGTVPRDGSATYAPSDHWADYRVLMDRPMTLAQAARLRAILRAVAPVRCRLVLLDFVAVAFIHNAAVTRNGSVTYGGA